MKRFEIRPLGTWPHPDTKPRTTVRFSASWTATVELLDRETDYLGAELVVVQVDVRDGEIRSDGMLSSRARVGHPGVVVSFDSRYGPLTYATDEFEARWSGDMPSWKANVRAIALSLEALRAVDRYGVTRRGEQYQGWTQLTARPAVMTREQAAEFIAEWAGEGYTAERVMADPGRAFKVAARQTYPDQHPEHADTFRRLTVARDLITASASS